MRRAEVVRVVFNVIGVVINVVVIVVAAVVQPVIIILVVSIIVPILFGALVCDALQRTPSTTTMMKTIRQVCNLQVNKVVTIVKLTLRL